jgi:hypothetical protein
MNRNSAKQKLKDLRTKLANLDIEIRALISKGEMEPGLIDAIASDIDGFTQEIVKIKAEISKVNSQGIDESLSLVNLFKEGAKDAKKTPDEVNQLALSLAKDIEIPDYVLNDEKLFAQFMATLRNSIQPKKKQFGENDVNEESTTGGEGYTSKFAFKKKQ